MNKGCDNTHTHIHTLLHTQITHTDYTHTCSWEIDKGCDDPHTHARWTKGATRTGRRQRPAVLFLASSSPRKVGLTRPQSTLSSVSSYVTCLLGLLRHWRFLVPAHLSANLALESCPCDESIDHTLGSRVLLLSSSL